jgi:hypothetical protein
MLKSFLIIVFFLSGISVFSQKYPEAILPGSSKTIESSLDTLWILKDSQLKKAIIAAKKLQIEEEISSGLKNKISLMEDKDVVKDSLIADYKNDRDFYMKKMKDCTNDVDLLIKKQKKQKLYTRLSLAGVVIAFIAGILIGK